MTNFSFKIFPLFLLGIFTIGIGFLLLPREGETLWIVISILVMLLGAYFLFATLFSHKTRVNGVSDEVFGSIIELPIKLITRALSKMGDLFP